jgi:hypothetical protein
MVEVTDVVVSHRIMIITVAGVSALRFRLELKVLQSHERQS